MRLTEFVGSGSLLTGGTSGLGAASAEALGVAGSRVVIAGRNSDAGMALAKRIGNDAQYCAVDVTDETNVQAAVAMAAAAPRGLRVAVSAAGVAHVIKTVGRGGVHPLDAFKQTMSVNVEGAFNLLRFAAEAMAQNEPDENGERGVIVLTSSIAAWDGQMGQVAYAASKGAVNSMVLPAARDLARSGIRVVGIAPGVFDTPFMDVLSDDIKSSIGQGVPFPQRLGRPEEFASLLMQIVTNSMINGEVIRLDGALRLGHG